MKAMSRSDLLAPADTSRREFVKLASVFGSGIAAVGCGSNEPLAESVAPTTQTFSAPIGVELYTVRGDLGEKTEETLRRIADIGYVEVEHNWGEVKPMLPLLNELGLQPTSIAIDTALVTDADLAERLDETAAEAKEAGADFFMFPALPEALRGDLDAYREFSDQFNRAGEIAMKHDVLLCYHNHAFEFEPMDGRSPFAVMGDRFAPGVAAFEIDVFWVTVAGHDPVEVLRQLEGRVPLLHLKDLAVGAEVRYNQGVPHNQFMEVGGGSVDFPAVLQQASESGVRHYFVEQDHTPADPIDSLRQSYEYLRELEI
jgi:sugar phosphate isomerase/epimerase